MVNLQGKTDLLELAARLREAHLLVSGDTGTLHLAAALGTRTLSVFLGPASCFETGPYGEGHYVFQAEPPCHPCVETGAGCLEPICQAMIVPEPVADLVISLCTNGKAPNLISLPAGSRLYSSFFDPLGVSYAPLRAGHRFLDLVGQAYRRAAAQLLGVDWPASSALFPTLSMDDQRNLRGLVAVLKNGGGFGGSSPALAAVLTPLRAFREEMRNQQVLGREAPEADDCLRLVEMGFRAAVSEVEAQKYYE